MNKSSETRWTLLFEPLGVLMFRDHRPFNAGQQFLARSRFPLPSVFRGAVRSALFIEAGADFRKRDDFGLGDRDRRLLGGPARDEAFQLHGPFVARREQESYEYVLPWPRDLFPRSLRETSGGRELDVVLQHRRTLHGELAPTGLRLGPARGLERVLEPLGAAIPWTNLPVRKPVPGTRWLTVAGAQRYAAQRRGELTLVEGRHWFSQTGKQGFLETEERVGIARATASVDRLVAAESMLYVLVTWRMAPSFRFAVEVDLDGLDSELHERGTQLLTALDGALVRLGGRSQHARVEVIHGSLAPDLGEPEQCCQPAKLWLWTPGLFDPADLAASCGLLGALADTIQVGGFDMAKHCPRPLVSALERGSVLWFSSCDPGAVRRRAPPTRGGYGHGLWIPTPPIVIRINRE